jgi:hypothetical protein
MDAPVPQSVLSAVRELREKVLRQVEELKTTRSRWERELQALGEEIESEQRKLELVEAIERQLAGQGRGQTDLEGDGPGASTQVRGSVKLYREIGGCVAHRGLCPCRDSPRQRLPSSDPIRSRPVSSRSLSPSPRGPSPRLCGGTTCCRC